MQASSVSKYLKTTNRIGDFDAETTIAMSGVMTEDVVADIIDASIFRQAKAVLKLRKAKNAIAFCSTSIKNYFLGKDLINQKKIYILYALIFL